MRKRAMLYCQHLAGIGHLVRSAELARSLSTDGWEVLLICGGKVPSNFPFPPSIDVELLEPIESDSEYRTLVPSRLGATLDAAMTARTHRLITLLQSFRPNLLITEMYPFGRKQFACELLPLLSRAKAAAEEPMIVASVRDILVAKKDPASHESHVLEVVNRYYDAVLVHSDEDVQPLRATFPKTSLIRPPVIHTGYITASSLPINAAADKYIYDSLVSNVDSREPFILVSCGSGRLEAARRLVLSAIEAAPFQAKLCRHNIIICAGPLVSRERLTEYQWKAVGRTNVQIVQSLPRLQDLMRRSSLSVSLGGYNTVMEMLSAGSQGLVYAADPNGDNEQMVRIKGLVSRGLIREIPEEALTGASLSGLMADALAHPLKTVHVQMNGAEVSAAILSGMSAHRRGVADQRRTRIDENSFSASQRNTSDLERPFKCA